PAISPRRPRCRCGTRTTSPSTPATSARRPSNSARPRRPATSNAPRTACSRSTSRCANCGRKTNRDRAASPPPPHEDGMDWTALRAEFPVTQRWAYFDHAAVAPITRRARQAMADWAQDVADNGHVNERAWNQRIEEIRRQFARLLGCDALDLAFVKNTSEGIGIVAEGYPWQSGDVVVTAAEEYPANLYPWMNLPDRGAAVAMVPGGARRGSFEAARDRCVCFEDVRAALSERTRLVSLSFVEYASGFRNDLEAIGALRRQSGILFFVDAIQGLGVLPLDVGRLPIDFLAADGHKWM